MTRGGYAVSSLLSLSGVATASIIGIALASPHLRDAPTSLVVSAVTAAVAVVLMSLQPFWALLAKSRPQVFGLHWAFGMVAFALVGSHVAALVVLSPDDVWFAISPDGPTRARMAVLATAALVAVVALGVARRRVPSWSGTGFAVLHSFFAALALLLGVGHAVLTDGALEGWGTILLCLLGAVGAAGIVAARARGRLLRVGVGSES